MEIATPHDVFFSTPAWCNEAIPKYIEEIEKVPELKEKIVILKYYWMKGDNHNRLSIAKIYGSFSDSDLDSEFKFKEYQSGEGDLEKIQGGYKIIYTEEELNETPIEYIMMILWHNVFPELINSATFDKTLERIKKEKITWVYIDEIIEVLNKLYVLKSSENITWSQVNRQMIIEAMKGFEKIQKAQRLDDSPANPKYRIIHSKISTHKSGLIDYLIKELNKEEFTKEANKEYQKTVNKTLTE
jgi:hypothetical protein